MSTELSVNTTTVPAGIQEGQPLHRQVEDCSLLTLQTNFLNDALAQSCFQQLLTEHDWPDNHYEVFGRRFSLPRQQTWHADDGIVYSYHNNLLQTRHWSPLLSFLRQQVEAVSGHFFNAVLVNLYRDGQDYVGWHSDDDIEMGEEPVIASLSLGAARYFSYRKQTVSADNTVLNLHTDSDFNDCSDPGDESNRILLPAGSLLLMAAEFQHQWQHSVLPCNNTEARINLTFRYVHPPSAAKNKAANIQTPLNKPENPQATSLNFSVNCGLICSAHSSSRWSVSMP